MRTRRFNQIDLPIQFKEYYTKYPHGMTIFEALIGWVNTVNGMVDNVNDLNKYMDDFINNFDMELRDEVRDTLEEWQNDGTLGVIINEALNTRIDGVEESLDMLKEQVNSTSINIKHPPAGLTPAIGDGVNDDTVAFEEIFAYAPPNTQILIPPGNYQLYRPIPITKSLFIRGTQAQGIYHNTAIHFYECSGFSFEYSNIKMENIYLLGHGKKESIDVENRDYGIIGLDMNRRDGVDLGGDRITGVVIQGFNIGVGMRRSGEESWSGAYRDFTGVIIRYNDIGVFVDGGTNNRFIGGDIRNSYKVGIYAIATQSYTNLELIGTLLESNGNYSVDGEGYGIYAKGRTKVRLVGGYLEDNKQFAEDGSSIIYLNTHIHTTTRHYSREGATIEGITSFSNYSHTQRFGDNYNEFVDKITFVNIEPTTHPTVGFDGNAVRLKVKGITTGNAAFEVRSYLRTLVADELEWVKVSFKMRVVSGGNNPALAISVTPKIESWDGVDGTNVALHVPWDIYDFNTTPYETVEFYFKPRVGQGYIKDKNTFLKTLMMTFKIANPGNFTSEELVVDLLEPEMTIFTKKDTKSYYKV